MPWKKLDFSRNVEHLCAVAMIKVERFHALKSVCLSIVQEHHAHWRMHVSERQSSTICNLIINPSRNIKTKNLLNSRKNQSIAVLILKNRGARQNTGRKNKRCNLRSSRRNITNVGLRKSARDEQLACLHYFFESPIFLTLIKFNRSIVKQACRITLEAVFFNADTAQDAVTRCKNVHLINANVK